MIETKYTKYLDDLATHLVGGEVSVIVGSGASDYEKFGVPKLKGELLHRLRLEGKEQLRINAFSQINKEPNDCGLEELLSIYANVYGESIHEFLDENGIKPKANIVEMPPLGYQILSHFIYNKLINNIISFNFDEFLEAAIDDEVGEDGYEWVRSKSIFQKEVEDMDRGGGLPPKPLLIKPHGTISYPVTIRPTFETVQTFEKEKQDLLEKVLIKYSYWVILGFSCPDADFQKILKKVILTHQGIKILWVDRDKKFSEQNQMFKFAKEILKDNCVFVKDDVDDFLKDLGDHIHENYRERYPGIARHKFRTYLDKWKGLRSISDVFRLETIIYSIRARGMFSLEGLLMCKRIDNCCKKITRSSSKIKDIIREIEASGFLIKNENIKSAEIYYIPVSLFGAALSGKILKMFSIRANANKQALLSKLIIELKEDFDFDFGKPDNYLFLKFYNPVVIRDFAELYAYDDLVIKSARRKISIISETGEWIVQKKFKPYFKEIKRKRIPIDLILADIQLKKDDSHLKHQKDKLKELQRFLGDLLTVRYLPWDKHNVHMTINENGSGIYFYRKYKSPVFTPIFVAKENKKDCLILKDEFKLYKSESYPEISRRKHAKINPRRSSAKKQKSSG